MKTSKPLGGAHRLLLHSLWQLWHSFKTISDDHVGFAHDFGTTLVQVWKNIDTQLACLGHDFAILLVQLWHNLYTIWHELDTPLTQFWHDFDKLLGTNLKSCCHFLHNFYTNLVHFNMPLTRYPQFWYNVDMFLTWLWHSLDTTFA